MITQRMIHFAFVPLAALALMAALFLAVARVPTPAVAAGIPDWQQSQPMTHTMPITETTPPRMEHRMHQDMMGQEKGMMGDMPMHPSGMGDQMVTMGRRMQMMGMMMQMMGQMQGMMDHMHGMMGGDMGMMQGRMQGNRPMTHTMPMTGSMRMGEGMGMMGKGMMEMPMMDMNGMHTMMGQMMDQMMAEMHEMHQSMGMAHGPMAPGMDHAMPMTDTALVSPTTSIVSPPAPLTVQAGAVEIKVTPLNVEDTDADTLDFAVEFNSHSQAIDLDLAQTATLTLGDVTVEPTAWETATPSGHHVRGVLHFPRTTEDGSALLADATEIALVIGGLPDGSEQTLIWRINPQ